MVNNQFKSENTVNDRKIEPKEWIITCNTDFYDLKNALITLKIIDWRQTVHMNNASVGDFIYMYCKPEGKTGSILYKGAILEVNKYDNLIDDTAFSASHQLESGRCFSLAMFRVYDLGDDLSYAKLKAAGLNSKLRCPVLVKGTVADYLHSCDERQRQIDRFEGTIPDECLIDFPIDITEISSVKTHSSDRATDELISNDISFMDLLSDVKAGKRTAWLFAPGEKGCMFDRFVEEGIAGIDWWRFDFGDLSEYESQEKIAEYMRYIANSDSSFKNDSLCLYQFSHEMRLGDVVFCKGGLSKLIGVGIVSTPYFHSDTDELGRYSKRYNCKVDTYKHRIGIEWLSIEQHETDYQLQLKTLTKLKGDTIDKIFNTYRDVNTLHRIVPLDDNHTEAEKIKHAESLTLDELKVIAQRQSKKEPKEITSTITQTVRDTYVASYTRRRANGICQLCGCPAPFNSKDGTPYLESHHIVWLSKGGKDSIENTVALCPNCHKKMHVVGDPEDVEWLKRVNQNMDSTS